MLHSAEVFREKNKEPALVFTEDLGVFLPLIWLLLETGVCWDAGRKWVWN